MSALSQPRWDALRFELLSELAVVVAQRDGDSGSLEPFVEACTLAFDRPVPMYTIYNRLRSFKAGAWPLLRGVIQECDALTHAPPDVADMLASATALLRDANSMRDCVEADALEVQLAVLQQLLAQHDN